MKHIASCSGERVATTVVEVGNADKNDGSSACGGTTLALEAEEEAKRR